MSKFDLKEDNIVRIGNVELASPFLLAPLAGITDAITRTLCEKQGAALTYTEMVSAKGMYYGDRKTKILTYIPQGAGPTAIQIFGSEPDIMAEAAIKLESLPNSIIDINMGCPVPKVVRNGDGSALMQDPELVFKVVRAVSGNTDKPVTVKIRKGFTDDNINAVEIALAAESGGAAAVAVHGRTRPQYYSGKSDRNIIKKVKEALKIPVIGNGDIFCAEDAFSLMNETGCDMVMVARGALGNPWIFDELMHMYNGNHELWQPPTDNARIEMMVRHLEMLCEFKGERIGVKEFRKFVVWYTKGMRGAAHIRRAVNDVEELAEMRTCLLSEDWERL